jgi:predicted amidophosphoribosyltransferase
MAYDVYRPIYRPAENEDFRGMTMSEFTIERNNFLRSCDVRGYYRAPYSGGSNWRTPGTIENYICVLKHDDETPRSEPELRLAQQKLQPILMDDIRKICQTLLPPYPTIAVVPRAKAETYYRLDQRLFRETVSQVANSLDKLCTNGTNFIQRHTNTRTTHRNKSGKGGDGSMPYPGITNDTCHISNNIKDKNVLLVDDLYTRTINVVEDAIQALLDKGAKSVTFYSIGLTKYRGQ